VALVPGMAYISPSPIGSLWRRSPSFYRIRPGQWRHRRRHRTGSNHSLGDRLLVGGAPQSREAARNDLQGEGSQHDAKDGGESPSTAEAVRLRAVKNTPAMLRDCVSTPTQPDGGEGAKLWLSVLTEIKNRGVEDVCFTVCDGLKDLPRPPTCRSLATT
jgi:hypothetical protein